MRSFTIFTQVFFSQHALHYQGSDMEQYNRINFEISRYITKSYSTSFYSSSRLLDPESRKAIFAIYGFVRFADEIVDTFHNVNKKTLLDNFEKQFREALSEGISTNPVLHSFVLTIRKYQIPNDLVDAFLQSMRLDLDKKHYLKPEEFKEYIYGSAEVVGLMCLKVFVQGKQESYLQLQEAARALGSAFQKVNFFRDLKTDTQVLGRYYFPDFKPESFDKKTKQTMTEDIRADFKLARSGIGLLPGRSRLAVYVAYIYYLALLRKIERSPEQLILSKRIRINNFHKSVLLFWASLRYHLKLL